MDLSPSRVEPRAPAAGQLARNFARHSKPNNSHVLISIPRLQDANILQWQSSILQAVGLYRLVCLQCDPNHDPRYWASEDGQILQRATP